MSKITREDKIKKRYNQLKGILPHLSKEEIKIKAEESVRRKEIAEDIGIESLFIDKNEQKKAKELLIKYIEDYSLESISDRNALKQLIYLEVYNDRMQNALNEISNETPQAIPKDIVDTLHRNLTEIVKFKEKLNIINKKSDKIDDYSELEKVQKKYEKWLQENQATRHIMCPYCTKLILLKIRTDCYNADKHPYFDDRVLCNVHLMKLFVEQKITKEDVAKIFGTSDDYIDWLIELWRKNPKYKEIVDLYDINKVSEENNKKV